MDKRRSSGSILAAILLLLPMFYVGSYLALVKPRPVVVRYRLGTSFRPVPTPPANTDYRWGGKWVAGIFWPLEQIDRRFRPREWEKMEFQRVG